MEQVEQKENISRETICIISCTHSFGFRWFWCVFAADGCVKRSTRECECPGNSHSAISSKQVATCPSFSQRNNASFFKRLNNPILTILSSSVDFAQSAALGRERPQPGKHSPLGSGSTLLTRFSSSICRHCLLPSHPLRTRAHSLIFHVLIPFNS